jgi:choline dehydrogenase-like flavoprotein
VAARWRTRWRRRARRSCSSNAATTCRARWPPGMPRACSSTAGTSRRTRGTTPTARSSSPGCTTSSVARPSFYGAALYRLRPGDFEDLHHVDGLSPAWPLTYDDFEPYYTRAEWLYQVHGNHGEDPTEGHWSKQYPWPAVSHEERIEQLCGDLQSAGYHPFHAPCGVLLDEAEQARSNCIRAARGVTDIRAWCTPSPTRRRSRSARSSTCRT